MAKVDSFTQFYGVALKETEAYYSGIAACDTSTKCKKEAFAVVYSIWSATDDTVTITIYFNLTCTSK